MAKRKKRNALTLVSLLLALAALIGVYFWYSNRDTGEKDSTDAESDISLVKVDTAKVTELHYVGDKIDINLVLSDGVWKSKEEPDRPINQDNVRSILKIIGDIKATQKVTDKYENMADYGFDKPTYEIQAKLKDGSTVSLKLGSQTVTSDGYYAVVNDETKVYLLSYTYKLSYTDMDMNEIVKAPEIKAENITYINIDSRDGEDVELKYNEKPVMDNSGYVLNNWQIKKPYEGLFSAESSEVSKLQSNYTIFDFIDCIDYKGEDLGKYGLDNPAAIIDIGYFESYEEKQPSTTPTPTDAKKTLKVDKNYKLYIGNKDDSGNYYIRSDGVNSVYTLSGEVVDNMLKVDVFSLMNQYIIIPNIDIVDGIKADFKGKQYKMELKRTTDKNDKGEEETKTQYYFEGKEVNEKLFKDLYQSIIVAKYDAVLKEKVDTSKLTPVLTLTYHIFGENEGDKTANFLPYNDSFYIADTGVGVCFLADKRSIDHIADTIAKFTPTKE